MRVNRFLMPIIVIVALLGTIAHRAGGGLLVDQR